MLPVSFGLEYVGINAHLPQHIIDEFTQKSFVTVDEMMDLYLRLMADYDQEFGHLLLGIPHTWNLNRLIEIREGSQPAFAVESSMLFETIVGNYIDFDTGTTDFTNPFFTSSLAGMREIFEKDIVDPVGILGTRILNLHGYALSNDRVMAYWANEYVFGIKSPALSPIHAFITPITPQFVHYIPLVDNQGRLLINPNPIRDGGSWSTVTAKTCITAGANVGLAWEFVKHMLEAYATNSFETMASPILRGHFENQVRVSVDRALGHPWRPNFEGRGDFDQHRLIRDYAAQRISAYNEMPMALLTTAIPHGLYEENLDLFLRGLMSTDDFIQRLHNTVSLWLIE